jgi:hypothetical protein
MKAPRRRSGGVETLVAPATDMPTDIDTEFEFRLVELLMSPTPA